MWRRNDILAILHEFAQDYHAQGLGSEYAEGEKLKVERRGAVGLLSDVGLEPKR
jgi:hypothetical protein